MATTYTSSPSFKDIIPARDMEYPFKVLDRDGNTVDIDASSSVLEEVVGTLTDMDGTTVRTYKFIGYDSESDGTIQQIENKSSDEMAIWVTKADMTGKTKLNLNVEIRLTDSNLHDDTINAVFWLAEITIT